MPHDIRALEVTGGQRGFGGMTATSGAPLKHGTKMRER